MRNELRIKNHGGFTLIELMIAVGLFSAFLIFIFATFNPIERFQKMNDEKRKSDLAQIQKALGTYYQDHEKYPPSDSSYQIVGLDGNSILWGEKWTIYMSAVPKDPDAKKHYVYYVADDSRQSYRLYASLEREGKHSPTCRKINNKCIGVPKQEGIAVKCGTRANDDCNYGVSSANVSP